MAATKKTDGAATLLVELLTEELPPKSLKAFGESFAGQVLNSLVQHQLKPDGSRDARILATPRRLAVLVPEVLSSAPDRQMDVTGPSVKAPPEAVAGFARKNGVKVEDLQQVDTPKGKVYACRATITGATLATSLRPAVEDALKRLPIPKVMRWGSNDAQFARPVHGLVMLHGSQVVPGEVLGAGSSNQTLGHRFLSGGTIALKQADEYEQALLDKGNVIVDFATRRAEISRQLDKAAGGATLVINDALLDEITSIVEAPAVYAGEFSPDFLAVPEECLILSMQQHQKYVPLRDGKTGKLLSRFLFVSNIETKRPEEIIHGNERVLRARLSDAKFFYDQDRKTRLADRVPKLANVVYHNKLGSQLDRVRRIQALAGKIAGALKADASQAERAAHLCKADLLTDMVGEFPELQGTMGRYYASHDGEPQAVADAIEAHYRPRFAGDALPAGPIGAAVALADKLETIVGIFGIGLIPTGDRDPFALRRHALGTLRILCEHQLKLDISTLLKSAHGVFPEGMLLENHKQGSISVPNYVEAGFFIKERAKSYLRDSGYSTLEIESVLDLDPMPVEYVSRLEAARAFLTLPESAGLAEADKRIRNILTKSGGASVVQLTDESRLQIDSEKQLLRTTRLIRSQVDELLKLEKFKDALLLTAQIHQPVTMFFEKVMVNVEDEVLRTNRFALLHEVINLTNRVANISKLAA